MGNITRRCYDAYLNTGQVDQLGDVGSVHGWRVTDGQRTWSKSGGWRKFEEISFRHP